jgi:predicted aspartyl protease
MGITTVEVVVKKGFEEKLKKKVAFLIDSGAVYSVVQRKILEGLGVKPQRKKAFFLANGEKIEREIGDAYFEYGGTGGAASVIFGEPGDSNLLGATTLEALELVLDPFHRELRPLTMSLMGAFPRYEGRKKPAGLDQGRSWKGLQKE